MTGRSEHKIHFITEFLKAQGLFREYGPGVEDPDYSGDLVELDLSTIRPSVAGPKRPHDKVELSNMKEDFQQCLFRSPVGFKGYSIPPDKINTASPFTFEGESFELKHGSVVIAAITSCTNTSNPDVML